MGTKKSVFEKELGLAIRQCERVLGTLNRILLYTEGGYADSAYEESFHAAGESEKLTQLVRTLPAHTGRPHAMQDTAQVTRQSIPVEFGFTHEGWFSARIPALLPKKKAGSASYIRDSLYPAFRHYFKGKNRVYFSEGVIILRHVYGKDRPERQLRDHDNIEVKTAIDIMAMFVLVDDAPLRCPHYYCSAVGDGNRTEIYIVPPDEFSSWLSAAQKYGDKAVKLYEKRP